MPSALANHARVITTLDEHGKSVFSTALPEEAERVSVQGGAAYFSLPYVTGEWPVDLNNDKDLERYEAFLAHPPGVTQQGGTVMRTVDFPPLSLSPMHRTVSLDFGIVTAGEIEVILDSGETRLLRVGDICVQRATMHAWKNPSKTEWGRMTFILAPAQDLEHKGHKIKDEVVEQCPRQRFMGRMDDIPVRPGPSLTNLDGRLTTRAVSSFSGHPISHL
ncbi:hypothetical protein EDB81DRAFT_700191 [Dactylonectria macrodidyma]|uniref:Uncharacterized protein n=1 Tax=Dactylonectria macrodidyma TaxID=307937 RepID=A0A9P9DM09_9HYPO|nr:hypothetical protein EDB81DRAFT_700191 [Dactylonectria macrodidyma]